MTVLHLQRCRPKEVPQHAESILIAVNAKNKKKFVDILTTRQRALTSAQAARVERILKAAEKI